MTVSTPSGREVARQLSADYPENSLGWVKQLHWQGPQEIPLDQVDYSHKKSWNAAKQPNRIAQIADKIAGRVKQNRRIKPVVVVDTPDTERGTNYKIIDGHHRALAYQKLSQPLWGYVARTPSTDGPWLEFHTKQQHGGEYGYQAAKGLAWESELRGAHGEWVRTHAGGGPVTGEPSHEDVMKHFDQWRDKMTPAQEKGLRFYQSPGFALMNGQLRGLDPEGLKSSEHASDSDMERARKASKDLTAAIRKAPPLPGKLTVYRGFSADQFGDLKPGAVITDKGFTSTSLTKDVAPVGRAKVPATAEIRLPAGTKAGAGASRELILPPGSSFSVVSTSGKGKNLKVVLELVPPRGAK